MESPISLWVRIFPCPLAPRVSGAASDGRPDRISVSLDFPLSGAPGSLQQAEASRAEPD